MAKGKNKKARRPAPQASVPPAPSLAPKILEKAAQGWLRSFAAPAHLPPRNPDGSQERLTQALVETLDSLRNQIADLRVRLDRLERKD